MTVVDVIIIFVIFLSALFSLIRGFVKEAISLASWILGIWLAATFAPRLAVALPDNIESEAVRLAIGFGVLFILSLIVGTLVNVLVAQLVKKTGLSGADRIFGVVFGLLRGVLIIVVFVLIGSMTALPQMEWWQSSSLLKRFEVLAIEIQQYIPEDLAPSQSAAPTSPAL
jgi:membrane protein required for colicin V production